MSYSRWGSSCWYAYMDVREIDNEQTLTLQDHWSYPLSFIIKNKEQILQDVRDLRFERNPFSYHGLGEPPKDRFTEEEIEELRQIIEDFIYDSKPESGWKQFLRITEEKP